MELALLQQQYLEKRINVGRILRRSSGIQEQGIIDRITLAKKYGISTADLEVQLNNLRIADRKAADKKTIEAIDAGYKAQR